MAYGRWRLYFKAFRQSPQTRTLFASFYIVAAPVSIALAADHVRSAYFNEDIDQWIRDRKYHASYQHTNADGSPAKFQYQALRQAGTSGDIRLVELLPGKGDEKIELKLRNYELRNKLRYFALSYEWGPKDPRHNVGLNGSPFPVQGNLFSALQHLRDPVATKTLWIDAICIDQENGPERTSHVQRMHDVYELAEGVIIWLGTSESTIDVSRVKKLITALGALHVVQAMSSSMDRQIWQKHLRMSYVDFLSHNWSSSDFWRAGDPLSYRVILETNEKSTKADTFGALDFVQECNENRARGFVPDVELRAKMELVRTTLEQEKDTQAWTCLRDMIENSYFERSWIIQELVLGKGATFQVGQHTFDAGDLFDAGMALENNPWLSKEVAPQIVFKRDALTRFWKLSIIRLAHRGGMCRMPLGSLLYDLRGKKASEDRDQIYSLIGIATYRTYEKPLSPQGQRTRPRLVHPSRDPKPEDLKGLKKWYWATFYGFEDPQPITMDVERSTDLVYLDAAAFILRDDQSLALLSQVNSASPKLRTKPVWPSWVPDWTMLAEPIPQDIPNFGVTVPEEHRGFTISGNLLIVHGHHVSTIAQSFTVPRALETNCAGSAIQACFKTIEDDQDAQETLRRLLIRDAMGGAGSKSASTAAMRQLQHTPLAPVSPEYSTLQPLVRPAAMAKASQETKHTHLLTEASRTWEDHTWTLCLTVDDKVVLGPASAKPGDHIFVVGGATSPLILRENHGKFVLVGDAYMYGLLNQLTAADMKWDMKKLIIV